jgi:Zn-dependent protease
MERPLALRERPPTRPRRTPAPRGGFVLARPFGIEVRIDPSWIAIAFLIVFSLGNQFALERPHLAASGAWIAAVAAGALFFASIVVHELSHSLVARARGLGVQGITLFVFGGISQVKGEPRRPKDEFWIAIVGPLASVALGVLFTVLGQLLPSGSLARSASSWLGLINFMLAGFNLLPGYPLDGGRVFRAAAWSITGSLRKATRIAARLGTVIGGLLIAWGAFLLFGTANFVSGLWLGLIGWFLISAAQRSVSQLELGDVLGRYRVRHAMRTECPRAGADETLEAFIEERVLGTGQRCFLVTDGDSLRGLVTLHELRAVPRDAWPSTRLAEVMLPLERVESVSPDEPLGRAFEKMDERDVNQIPVVEDGILRGLVTREDILRVLATDLELRRA